MTMTETDTEATAFLGMAENLRAALTERDNSVRPYREWYDRLLHDFRMAPTKRAKIAAEFLRAAYRADHVYGERVEEGLEEYRRLTRSEDESRY